MSLLEPVDGLRDLDALSAGQRALAGLRAEVGPSGRPARADPAPAEEGDRAGRERRRPKSAKGPRGAACVGVARTGEGSMA
ncbi:hypothetical protein KBZ21_17505 [Streptomyces sp. A73]|uniref:hypothetical protein n=1 Tax=unclassified Streptomyces TaxID=2593676 RepID=UPI000C175E4B|nr:MULTISPECIES: hypothetical protein [unclassified Streptomyces]MBQ0862595.1 hypothetical protein [Streptomyces sp. RK75]MBQ1124513.1 hypothetical protein [Streptomyces sp. B15]MBQ1159880.1 hypothetical protein [Streptomyces sp. A73]